MKKRRGFLYRKYLKRPFDFVVAFFGLIILSPLLLLIAILVRIKLGSPILFKQKRPGKNEEIFTLYKFRTMTNKTDEFGVLLPDSERMTKFGQCLRSTSFDELPGLFNLLLGDISLVGPRPLLPEYLPLYNEEQRRRHEIRPGITGLAQINGRNSLSWDDKFRLDVQYIDSVSFLLDIKILINTFYIVLSRKGVSSSNHVTMELFNGNGGKSDEK